MREAMERQCESHALLCVQMDNFNCDVFIGVGCLDDNSQTSSTLPLVFQALPVEGYVYVDSVPVNMTPCIGNQEVDLYTLFRLVQKLGGTQRVTDKRRTS